MSGRSSMAQQQGSLSRISCNSCRYFYITWNKNYPYGCRAIGFISSKLPSTDVLEIEGRDCLSFKEKQSIAGADLCNNSKNWQEENKIINVIV